MQMSLPAHDVFLNVFSESGHDGIDDEQDGDTERRSENGKQRNERDERPLGAQVSQCQKDV